LLFGSRTLTSTPGQDPVLEDVFVARIDTDGEVLAAEQFGDDQSQVVKALAPAGNGTVLLTGPFGGALDFGNGELSAQSGADIFLAKLDTALDALWADSFGGSATQSVTTLSVDGSGHAIISGAFTGSGLDFGAGPLGNFTDPGELGEEDMFLAKFDQDGLYILSKRYGQAGSQAARASAIDPNRNVFIGGLFSHNVDFGGETLTAVGEADMFVAKFGP
jgi:hypothetical protein